MKTGFVPGKRRPSPEPVVARWRHREMLWIACVTVLASFLLDVGGGGQVHLAGLPDLVIPGACLSTELFGIDCPGCGLTRSFVHLAHLDLRASWEMHRLGWLLFAATLLQIPYRLHGLFGRRGTLVSRGVARGFGWLLIGLLIANWLVGIVLDLGLK